MATATKPAPQRVVRVWFGDHKIAEYTAEPALASRYEAAMMRRFNGTVHVEELPTQPRAFEALLASIRALDVAAVIVPTPIHLGARDEPGSPWNRLWLDTGVEVVFTDSGP